MSVDLAGQGPFAAGEKVPDRLDLALDGDITRQVARAHDSQSQGGGRGLDRQGQVSGGADRIAIAGLGLDAQAVVDQNSVQRSIDGQSPRRVDTADPLQRDIGRAGQVVARAPQRQPSGDRAAHIADQGAQIDAGQVRLNDRGPRILPQLAQQDAAADGEIDACDAAVSRKGDDSRITGCERDLADTSRPFQHDRLGRTFPRIDAGTVERNRGRAPDIGLQAEGQAVQGSAPVEVQGPDHPGRSHQPHIAAVDVQNRGLGTLAVGQPDPAVGGPRGQEGPRAGREGQVGAGREVVGQGNCALGRHAAGIEVDVRQPDAISAEEEIPAGDRGAVV